MDEPDDCDTDLDGIIREKADEVPRVILVADVGSGTTPAAATGQPRSPTYAVIELRGAR